MIHSIYRASDGEVYTDLSIEKLQQARLDLDGLLWVDLVEEPIETCTGILQNIFGFHHLAVEDALIESHVPKVDDWDDYVYLVLHATQMRDGEKTEAEIVQPLYDTLELDCFIGPNYLVTFQVSAIHLVGEVRLKVMTEDRLLTHNPTYLLYILADTLIGDYMKMLDRLDEEIDLIEDGVFRNPTPDLPEKIFMLRRVLLRLRRILAPQREVLNKLARGDFKVIDESRRIFFRDIYDHLVRMHDITESMRDLIGSALDTYLSVINNRMNDVMKVLTIITTLFMPMSFLSGFFGMNFFQPVRDFSFWTDTIGFILMLTLMCVAPVSLYFWMRKRAWL